MPSRTRRTAADLCLLVALVVACLALFASAAFAAPSDPIMGIADLETKLAASPTGTLQGYLKTVWRGSAIETVPVEIQAVTLGQQTGPESMSTLILFEASGPKIAKYGGIVAGMSGSPIYVDDGGTDKLVGALSYGDAFTIGGSGLATPIEAMAQLETDYPQPLIAPLSAPVQTQTGLKSRVMVVPDPRGIDPASMQGTFVAKPLAAVFLGGVSPNSAAYKAVAEKLKAKGYDLVPMGAPSSAAKASFSAPFEPGSALSAVATHGDLWYGGIGTTTYSNGDNVVAFGHPMFWEGDSGLFLGNAWIDGVWPSDYMPYKLGSLGAIRGTITQDRGAGIMGTTASLPAETPINASATNADTGKTASSAVYVSRHVMGSNRMEFEQLPALSSYVASSRVLDLSMPEGSAHATTTVVVTDGSDTYTITRVNVFDNSYDIGAAVTNDVYAITRQLSAVNNNGVGHAEVLSVNLESTIKRQHNKAQIVDVKTPNGLRVGDNKVVVSLARSGVVETQTVEATLTIPAGTSLNGELSATCADEFGFGTTDFGFGMSAENYGGVDRRTLADALDDINAMTTNNILQVEYRVFGDTPPDLSAEGDLPIAAEVDVKTPYYVTGSKTKMTSSMQVDVSATTIPYAGMLFAGGLVNGATGGDVKVYRRYSDETSEVLVATAPIDASQGDAIFDTLITGTTKTCVLRFHYDGDSETLASEVRIGIKVAARVSLKATPTSARYGAYVTLKATVLPAAATGSVGFEKLVSGKWIRIATKPVAAGSASYKFKPAKGTTTYRARYLGGPTNVAGTSGSVKVVMK
jgi:hypothetical protein